MNGRNGEGKGRDVSLSYGASNPQFSAEGGDTGVFIPEEPEDWDSIVADGEGGKAKSAPSLNVIETGGLQAEQPETIEQAAARQQAAKAKWVARSKGWAPTIIALVAAVGTMIVFFATTYWGSKENDPFSSKEEQDATVASALILNLFLGIFAGKKGYTQFFEKCGEAKVGDGKERVLKHLELIILQVIATFPGWMFESAFALVPHSHHWEEKVEDYARYSVLVTFNPQYLAAAILLSDVGSEYGMRLFNWLRAIMDKDVWGQAYIEREKQSLITSILRFITLIQHQLDVNYEVAPNLKGNLQSIFKDDASSENVLDTLQQLLTLTEGLELIMPNDAGYIRLRRRSMVFYRNVLEPVGKIISIALVSGAMSGFWVNATKDNIALGLFAIVINLFIAFLVSGDLPEMLLLYVVKLILKASSQHSFLKPFQFYTDNGLLQVPITLWLGTLAFIAGLSARGAIYENTDAIKPYVTALAWMLLELATYGGTILYNASGALKLSLQGLSKVLEKNQSATHVDYRWLLKKLLSFSDVLVKGLKEPGFRNEVVRMLGELPVETLLDTLFGAGLQTGELGSLFAGQQKAARQNERTGLLLSEQKGDLTAFIERAGQLSSREVKIEDVLLPEHQTFKEQRVHKLAVTLLPAVVGFIAQQPVVGPALSAVSHLLYSVYHTFSRGCKSSCGNSSCSSKLWDAAKPLIPAAAGMAAGKVVEMACMQVDPAKENAELYGTFAENTTLLLASACMAPK